MFSTRLENSLPFSSKLKLSSANSFSLEEPKIVVLERVKLSLTASLVHFLNMSTAIFFTGNELASLCLSSSDAYACIIILIH